MQVAQPELFEPQHYIDYQGTGYFSVLSKPSGRARQESYQTSLLPTVVSVLPQEIDTWITQAVFNQPNRRAVNLRSVGLLFADLDTYNVPAFRGKTSEQLAWMLVEFCCQEDLPPPSIVLFSGRGLQAKWLLDEALGPPFLCDWNAVQLALVKLLEPFAADVNSKDVSRVLRVDRTVNTKSGERCRVVHVTGDPLPARYDFEDLRAALSIPERYERPLKREKPKNITPYPGSMALQRLNWFRLYDIRDLWKIRGGVPVGFREIALFWEINFLLLAEPGKYCDLWKEAQALAREIDPDHRFYQRSDLSTVYRKAKAMREGRAVLYRGQEYPSLYTPKNQTLLELFQVTPEEERKLRTIISTEEKVRRRREKRWADGVQPRISRPDKPWKALGISRATWYRLGRHKNETE